MASTAPIPSAAPEAPSAPPEKTILGRNLRSLITTIVNGMGRGLNIRVYFRGTRAFTNGRDVTLPAIRDMAEIPMSVARALIGYAIHEVAHIRYTDFKQVARSYALGDLVQKFANGVEDYRIEGVLSKAFLGAGPDLTQMRILIHPSEARMRRRKAWLADPRACGPLALTWTGSLLNGFNIPGVRPTLDMLPAPVRALVDNWTARMTGVADTTAVVDLAAQFAAEAEAYAEMTRNDKPQPKPKEEAKDEAQKEPQPEPEAEPEAEPPTETNGPEPDATPDQEQGQADAPPEASASPNAPDEPAPAAGSDEPTPEKPSTDEPTTDENINDKSVTDETAAGETVPEGDAGETGPPPQDSDGAGDDADADGSEPADRTAPEGPSDETSGEGEADGEDADPPENAETSPAGGETKDGEPETGNPETGGAGTEEDGDGNEIDADEDLEPMDPMGPGDPDIDMGGGDPPASGEPAPRDDSVSQDSDAEGAGTPQSSERPDESDPKKSRFDPTAQDAPKGEHPPSDATERDAQAGDGDGAGNGDATSGNGGDGQAGEGETTDGDGAEADDVDEPNPFGDALDPNAVIDDIIDDIMRGLARSDPLGEEAPEADDGEVNPADVLKAIAKANSAAPAYDSSASDLPPPDADNTTPPVYSDTRFHDVRVGQENALAELRATASGAIANTARVVKRLLRSQEVSGVRRNLRDGDFDMENTSSIVIGDGQCYRRTWKRNAPTTLLAVLGDFSGSMNSRMDWTLPRDELGRQIDAEGNVLPPPLQLAVTGMLAIEQATLGTSVDTRLYGYTGHSPEVVVSVFKDGRASRLDALRKLGSYRDVGTSCTPTGEAIAAVAARIDAIPADRRVMLVLTDGTADDQKLCADVARVVTARGIELVAIGICNDAVRNWAPVHHVIEDVNELPKALLSTIDPRGVKKRRAAA